MIDLYKGDCLQVMDDLIAKGIIVDAIITDPPYGTTACKWDTVIPFEEMWKRLNKLIKPNGAIVLFGSEPFSSLLRVSNISMYKYDWKWEKDKGSNYIHANYQPLKNYEDIIVFSKGGAAQGSKIPMVYNRQYTEGTPYDKGIGINTNIPILSGGSRDNSKIILKNKSGMRSPLSIQKIKSTFKRGEKLHPTQKPVALMEYLIKTYTNENEMVLDFTMGSFTTAIACLNTKRNFIGIELDDKYFEAGSKRVNEHLKTLDYVPEICYNL